MEVIFVDLLLAKTKTIYVGVVYRPPKDTIFLQLFAENLNSLKILENEIFALHEYKYLAKRRKFVREKRKHF